jgi:type III secretion protein L
MSARNILKQQNSNVASNNLRSVVVKRPLLEAKSEAARILAEAEETAKNLLLKTQEEVSALREAAYQEGYESALSEFTELLFEARERRDAAISQSEKDLLQLAVKIAEKIIVREIKRDSKALVDMIANALRNIRHQDLLTVRVNPADVPTLTEFRDSLQQSYGCVIESEFGTVDAQLETQLRILERALVLRADSNKQD